MDILEQVQQETTKDRFWTFFTWCSIILGKDGEYFCLGQEGLGLLGCLVLPGPWCLMQKGQIPGQTLLG